MADVEKAPLVRQGEDDPPQYDGGVESVSTGATCHAGDYKDWPYAVLFVLNTIILLGLLGAFYDEQYFDLRKTTGAEASTTGDESVWLPLGVAFGTGILLSIGWLMALRACPKVLVQAGIAFAVAMPLVMCILCLVQAGSSCTAPRLPSQCHSAGSNHRLSPLRIGRRHHRVLVVLRAGDSDPACMFADSAPCQSRIALAAKMLEMSSKFISEHYSLVSLSITCVLVNNISQQSSQRVRGT